MLIPSAPDCKPLVHVRVLEVVAAPVEAAVAPADPADPGVRDLVAEALAVPVVLDQVARAVPAALEALARVDLVDQVAQAALGLAVLAALVDLDSA